MESEEKQSEEIKKLCGRCKKELPATTEFFARNESKWPVERRRGGLYLTPWCRQCVSEYDKERYRANHEAELKRANAWRLRNAERLPALKRYQVHGVTPDYFNVLWDRDHGKCPICNRCFRESRDDERPKPHVDHCHSTKVIRGLLCDRCNHLLGFARDDPSILMAAIRYLERELPEQPPPRQQKYRKRKRGIKQPVQQAADLTTTASTGHPTSDETKAILRKKALLRSEEKRSLRG